MRAKVPCSVTGLLLWALCGTAEAQQAQTSVNHNVNANPNTNVNRNDVNVNRNPNIHMTRDIDVNVNRGYYGGAYYGGGSYGGGYYGVGWGGCCYNQPPGATAAAVSTAEDVPAAPIGTRVYTLPAGCSPVVIGANTYEQCGSTWYQPQFVGAAVSYVVVNAPR